MKFVFLFYLPLIYEKEAILNITDSSDFPGWNNIKMAYSYGNPFYRVVTCVLIIFHALNYDLCLYMQKTTTNESFKYYRACRSWKSTGPNYPPGWEDHYFCHSLYKLLLDILRYLNKKFPYSDQCPKHVSRNKDKQISADQATAWTYTTGSAGALPSWWRTL